jgi:hypothetical protein
LILFNIPVFAEITVYFYEHLVGYLMYYNVTGLRMIWGLFLMITVSYETTVMVGTWVATLITENNQN